MAGRGIYRCGELPDFYPVGLHEGRTEEYKSLSAYKLSQDGWIRQILLKLIGDLHLFRAKVLQIMVVYLTAARIKAGSPQLRPQAKAVLGTDQGVNLLVSTVM